MSKKLMDKIKEGVTVQEVEDFARKYTMEVFFIVAIAFASISSMYDFFTGAKLSIFFAVVGLALGIFLPSPVEKALKQFYAFSHKQEKTTQLILGCVQVIVGLFVPFVLFCGIGLLAGTSYHYYTRHAQMTSENKSSHRHHSSSDELD
jgi:hypothetical protein